MTRQTLLCSSDDGDYIDVPASGVPNFLTARIILPSHVIFNECKAMIQMEQDAHAIDCVKYVFFPTGYEGQFPNLPLAIIRPHSITSTMCSLMSPLKFGSGPCMDLLTCFPPPPRCQVNALLTCPKKDCHMRRVIIDLSWLHSPVVNVNSWTPKELYLGVPRKIHLLSFKILSSL